MGHVWPRGDIVQLLTLSAPNEGRQSVNICLRLTRIIKGTSRSCLSAVEAENGRCLMLQRG